MINTLEHADLIREIRLARHVAFLDYLEGAVLVQISMKDPLDASEGPLTQRLLDLVRLPDLFLLQDCEVLDVHLDFDVRASAASNSGAVIGHHFLPSIILFRYHYCMIFIALNVRAMPIRLDSFAAWHAIWRLYLLDTINIALLPHLLALNSLMMMLGLHLLGLSLILCGWVVHINRAATKRRTYFTPFRWMSLRFSSRTTLLSYSKNLIICLMLLLLLWLYELGCLRILNQAPDLAKISTQTSTASTSSSCPSIIQQLVRLLIIDNNLSCVSLAFIFLSRFLCCASRCAHSYLFRFFIHTLDLQLVYDDVFRLYRTTDEANGPFV